MPRPQPRALPRYRWHTGTPRPQCLRATMRRHRVMDHDLRRMTARNAPVIYLTTTPYWLSPMRDSAPASARPGRLLPYARAALLAVAVGFALAGCKVQTGPGGDAKAAQGAEKAADAVPVEVAAASRRSIAANYSGTAALEAHGEAQVVAKTSGIALEVLADVGQQVRAGQVLLRIDRDRATLQVAQADAQVRKLEANYRRAAQLVEQKMVSVNDVDQLRFDLENARATLRLARLELSYGTVTAPIAGVVSTRDIKPGNFVQINTPI